MSKNWRVVAAWFLFKNGPSGLAAVTIGGGDDLMGTLLISAVSSVTDICYMGGVVGLVVANGGDGFRWCFDKDCRGCLAISLADVGLGLFRRGFEHRNLWRGEEVGRGSRRWVMEGGSRCGVLGLLPGEIQSCCGDWLLREAKIKASGHAVQGSAEIKDSEQRDLRELRTSMVFQSDAN